MYVIEESAWKPAVVKDLKKPLLPTPPRAPPAVPKAVLTQSPHEPTRKRCRTDSRKSSHREEWNDKNWEDTTSVEDWVSFDWTP